MCRITQSLLLFSVALGLSTGCQSQNVAVGNTAITSFSLVPSDTLAKEVYSAAYIMGRFNPEQHPDFQVIPPAYRDNDVRWLRKEALAAFQRMHEAAAKEGIRLVIISATRNFDVQKRIWENKWMGRTRLEGGVNAATDIQDDIARARKILEYSSMPGTSRHHWGTDIDINSLENSWFESGEGAIVYNWMMNHARDYGFCQPYTKLGSDRQKGYFEEKWHWTYMPLSVEITRQAREMMTNDMITGFMGAETAKDIDVIRNYMLGISPACNDLEK